MVHWGLPSDRHGPAPQNDPSASMDNGLPDEALPFAAGAAAAPNLMEAVPGEEAALQRALELDRKLKARQFIMMPLLSNHCYLLRRCLAPELQLMHSLVHASGGPWEQKQLWSMSGNSSATKSRPRRILQLHCAAGMQDSAAHNFFRDCLSLLDSAELWGHCAPSQMLANVKAKLVLRSAAVVFQLCTCAFRAFPLKLFGLLREADAQEIVREVLELPPCRAEGLVAAFRAAYPTAEMLQSVDARATLKAILAILDGSTYTTERLHSQNLVESTDAPDGPRATGCKASSIGWLGLGS